jgi:hypothetical protein
LKKIIKVTLFRKLFQLSESDFEITAKAACDPDAFSESRPLTYTGENSPMREEIFTEAFGKNR